MTVLRWISIALAALVFAAPAGATTVVQHNGAENRLVQRINHVRENHGLKPLHVVTRLTNAATRHSNSMANVGYFRHELRHNGKWKSFGTWIRWYWPGPGYTAWSAGENLAWGAPGLGVRKTVSLWMHSPGHRANLLNKDWNKIGVSIAHVTEPGRLLQGLLGGDDRHRRLRQPRQVVSRGAARDHDRAGPALLARSLRPDEERRDALPPRRRPDSCL